MANFKDQTQAEYDECFSKCLATVATWSKDELLDELIRSGCSDDTQTLRNTLIKGLATQLCGCRCSGTFPFADKGAGSSELPDPDPELIAPWAVGVKK